MVPPLAGTGERRTPLLFRCVQCALVFVSEELLGDHQRSRRHYRSGKHRCRFCGFTSDHAGSVRRHEVTHTGKKPFECRVCSRAFTRKTGLEKHVSAVHEGKRAHRCATCGDTFQQKHHLRDHERVHSDDRPYGCDGCGTRFKLRRCLLKHARLHAASSCGGLRHPETPGSG
ncbi:zinc finger and SCAN domain-containing protein 22-like [Ornithodoros turicata]|uniref:zinc finger and SCAN domain-containing protein 22-like n=1 Tax=Ornithodoros turicata TaxID=34597 RepID=UPI003139F709